MDKRDHRRPMHMGRQSDGRYWVPNCLRKFNPHSIENLKNLAQKDPSEIVLTIVDKSNGLSDIIRDKNIEQNTMAYILILIGKACQSSLRANVVSMVNYITSSNFLVTVLQHYLTTFKKFENEEYHMESLVHLVDFLRYFQSSHPASASEKLQAIVPMLKSACESSFKSTKMTTQEMLAKIADIEKGNSHFLSQHNSSDGKHTTENIRVLFEHPPESYRTIPTLPTQNDIQKPCSFLRPNIVRGKYQSCEHYLDIQFRLLREDYVRPLRDGILAYKEFKKNGEIPRYHQDVKYYQHVHIIKQELYNGQLVHVVQFNINELSKVRWRYSKRFLTGSLLCLSPDDFKTLYFASVARRFVEDLKRGVLLLHFEDCGDEVLNISPQQSLVIIETDAYFEAYRYNLDALHQLNEDNMPMKRYIINVEKRVRQPKYLTSSTTYDFRPLLLPMSKLFIRRTVSNDIWYDFPYTMGNKLRDVCILNDDEWPTAEDMNFDASQYAALKAAITKEFALIQGPPGTGKTYVGLRIVQLLLHNVSKWQSTENAHSPILVVCHTNHALDQFLEGVLAFSNRIVRIGGQSSNKAVSRYQLKDLKFKIRSRRRVPYYIFSNISSKLNYVKVLKRNVDNTRISIGNSHKILLGETLLRDQMGELYKSLKSEVKKCSMVDDGNVIKDWLGARVQTEIRNKLEDEMFEANSEEYDGGDRYRSFKVEFEDGVEKAKKDYVAHNLLSKDVMTEQEAKKIRDVWRLSMFDRWRLYRYWLSKYVTIKQAECVEMQQMLRTHYDELTEMQMEEDLYVLRDSHVVGMTTTGAAKYRHILQRLNPRILIVEEAAEILESHIVTSMARDTQHVILIGDHQQLRPTPTVHALAVQYDLNISLFERMVNNGMERYQLRLQHRMRPEIASLLVPYIYKNLDNHESVKHYDNIKGVGSNMFFIDHCYGELQEDDSKSKVNQHEAEFLIRLCKYLILQGYKPSQITILTTYTGQLFALKNLARGIIENVRITVVDNFQGEENDIVLISFVRSNEDGFIGFLRSSNRVCVALSRAKKALYCIGNFRLLSEKSELWKKIVCSLREKSAIGPSLKLVCQNHPNWFVEVATERDFDATPEGGCKQLCEYRLDCGHTCPMLCHGYSKAHDDVRCPKMCNRQCSGGHRCRKKCYEDCGPCEKIIEMKLSPCNHFVKVACYKSITAITCKNPCPRLLSCGHPCTKQCGRHCTVHCKELVTLISPVCGHEVKILCYQSDNQVALANNCMQPCGTVLQCEHVCKGTCAWCLQGRVHVQCNEACNRVLVCGHECKNPCSKSCPPCKMECENRCKHSKCPKPCGVPCEKCTEPCESVQASLHEKCTKLCRERDDRHPNDRLEYPNPKKLKYSSERAEPCGVPYEKWTKQCYRVCGHKKCTKLCGELCDQPPCDQPCPKKLQCTHPCIGLCGEPCPQLCRTCDRAEVTELFFGFEDDEDARFIVLDDCKHLVEIGGMNRWVNSTDEKVQLKTCPKCKTPIRTNSRFANAVKQSLLAIEKIKAITFGDKKGNVKKQRTLLTLIEKQDAEYRCEFENICCELVDCIQSKTIRNIQEITTMENIINIAFEFIPATMHLPEHIAAIQQANPHIATMLQNLRAFLTVAQSRVTTFIQNEYLQASEQSLQEVTWEVHRLKLINQTSKFAADYFVQSSNEKAIHDHFVPIVNQLNRYTLFREPDVHRFASAFQEMQRSAGCAVINVSVIEKRAILKAMDLSRGHWYQCPNGHVYCITECGGAIQEACCNECGATIGGGSHRLREDNRVATSMDGARHSAWGQEKVEVYNDF